MEIMVRNGTVNLDRRTLLKGSGAIAGASVVPIEVGAQTAEVVRIGDFEDGLDGWKTDGGVSIDRVSADERPRAVTHGNHALRVDAGGDPRPRLRKQLRKQDLGDRHFLAFDVWTENAPDVDAVAEEVTFEVTLRYDRGASGGGRGRGGTGGPPVVTRTETVPFGYGGPVVADLSDAADGALERPTRVELAIGDGTSASKAAGRGPADPLGAVVFLDDVRFTGDPGTVTAARLSRQVSNLLADHGPFTYDGESFTGTAETGSLNFADGTVVPVRLAFVGDGTFTLDVGDETYEFEGERR